MIPGVHVMGLNFVDVVVGVVLDSGDVVVMIVVPSSLWSSGNAPVGALLLKFPIISMKNLI